MRFELRGTNFPNSFYKSYSHTWDDLEKTIRDETDFCNNLKISNPWKDEIKTLTDTLSTEKEKIEKIYDFVKKHVRWDETYSFYGSNPKEASKKGIGNNAQINFLLMSALKDVDIKIYPILINRRSLGRLPLTCPSLNRLNTFIVCAETLDSAYYYMDGSATYGGVNMLPTDLMVDRGRVFDYNREDKWVDLSRMTKNFHISNIVATINKETMLVGRQTTILTNQLAYGYKKDYDKAKDSASYVESYQNALHVTIDTFMVTGREPVSNSVIETMSFFRQLESTGDYLYINPMIFNHITTNNFTQADRKLPVEFSFPYAYQVITTLTIPDDYNVEEMPKSVKIKLGENKGSCQYFVTHNENTLQFKYLFSLNEIIYPFMDYPYLRDFFGEVVNKNLEMVVLKKSNL
jgi:hypothetical protein